MKKFDNLEDFMRSNLKEHEQAPPDAHWDKIWGQVPVTTPNPSATSILGTKGLLLSGIITALTIACLTFFIYWRKSEKALSIQNEKLQQIENQSTRPVENSIQNTIVNEENVTQVNDGTIAKSEAEIKSSENQSKESAAVTNETAKSKNTLREEIKISQSQNSSLKYSNEKVGTKKSQQLNRSNQSENRISSSSQSSLHEGKKLKSNVSTSGDLVTAKQENQIDQTDIAIQQNNIVDQAVLNSKRNDDFKGLIPSSAAQGEFSKINNNENSENLIVSKIPSFLKAVEFLNGVEQQEIKSYPTLSFSRIEKVTQKSEIAHGAHLTYYMNKSSLEYKSHDRPIGRRNFINEKSIYGTSIAAGYHIQMPIRNQGWALRLSGDYINTNYVMNHKINFKFRDRDKQIPPNNNRESEFRYNLNTGSGTIDIDARSVNQTNENIDEQAEVGISISAKRVSQYIALPILVMKEFNVRKIQIGLGVGLKPYYELSNTFSLNSIETNHRSLHFAKSNSSAKIPPSKSKFGTDAVMQTYIHWNISKKFKIGLEPIIEQSVRDNKDNEFAKHNTFRFGLSSSVIWKF